MTPQSDRGVLARFQAAVVDETSTYRQFVRATAVATGGVVGAYGVLALGLVDLSPAVVAVFRTAAGVAVALFLLLGLVQFVVIARAYERRTETVAETADHLEAAAEEVETAAEQVADAAETVDGPAARERTEAAKDTADAVRETVERERETRPTDGEDDERDRA